MKIVQKAGAVVSIGLLGIGLSTATANAAPPKPNPDQAAVATCVATQTTRILREIDRTVWRDPRARQAAIDNAYKQVLAACAVKPPVTTTTSPTKPPVTTSPTTTSPTTTSPTTTSPTTTSPTTTTTTPPGTVTRYETTFDDYGGVKPHYGYSSTAGCDNFGQRPGPDRLIDQKFDTKAVVSNVVKYKYAGDKTSNNQSYEYIQFQVQNDTDTFEPLSVTVYCENVSP